MTAILEVGGGGFEEPVTASGVLITVTLVDGERMPEEPDRQAQRPRAGKRPRRMNIVFGDCALRIGGWLILN